MIDRETLQFVADFLSKQYEGLRADLKNDIGALRSDLRDWKLDLDARLDKVERRVEQVERHNWKVYGIAIGLMFVFEVLLRVAEVYFK